jgi:exonuclease III
MKIVTYNGAGKENWGAALSLNPDILLFQEAKPPPEDVKSQTEWQPTRNRGTAVYVKKGTISRPELKHDHEWLRGWLVGVEVEGGPHPFGSGRNLRIFSLHAPPQEVSGNSYAETVKRMLEVVASNRRDADLVLGGDFNLSIGERHGDETNHKGEPWKTKKDEKEIHSRLSDLGLMNCWQTANPGVPLAQTLRWVSNPIPAYHCDGIFVPASWKPALLSSSILNTEEWTGDGKEVPTRSDHNPVVATFSQSTE